MPVETNEPSLFEAAEKARPRESGGPAARSWMGEVQAILQIPDRQRMLQSTAALLAAVTSARAAFIYSRQGGDLDCVASRIQQELSGAVMENAAVRQTISEALLAGFLRHAILRGEDGDQLMLLAMPVQPVDDRKMALVVVVDRQPGVTPGQLSGLMHVAALTLSHWQNSRRTVEFEGGFQKSALFLEMLNRAAQAPDYRRATATLADEMRRFVGCDQVAIGLGTQHRCRVDALSTSGQFDPRGQPSILLAELMKEAIAVGKPIGWPGDALPRDQSLLPAGDHRRLAEALEVDWITAIPLRTEDGFVCGAWVCLWKGNLPEDKWRTVQALTPHLAATAHLIELARPRGLRGVLQAVLAPDQRTRRTIMLSVAAAVLAAMFIPIPHRLGADCWIVPDRRREVAAPIEGVLERPAVQPGDLVSQGELLATLDGREINWKLAEARSRLEVALKQRNQAMASNDMPAAHLADLEAQALQVDIDLLESQRQDLEVRAPMDGLVLTGDLEQSEGVPVARGQKLFEIAEIDQLEVRIAVPDEEISRVEAGMPVHLRLESQVGYRIEGEIESVQPSSRMRDGQNVFLCVTHVNNESGALRPGMRGKARIHGELRPVGWVLFHRFWDFVRLRLPW